MRPLFLLTFLCLLLVGRARAAVVSVIFAPDTVVGGVPSVGTLTLDGPAPAGGVAITLASSIASVVVPSSISVPAGQTSVTFSAVTSTVTDQVLVIITATVGGAAKTGSLTVNPVNLASVAANPPAVLNGATSVLTISLNGPAPKGGLKIPITSTAREAPVPTTVTIPAGQQAVTINIVTKAVASPVVSTITASLGYVETMATLTVNPNGPASVTLNPPSVNGKLPSVGTVNLYGPAIAGGMTINLSCSSRAASIPATVKIVEGQTSATFPITTVPVSILTLAAITAKFNGTSTLSTLSVLAPTITTTVLAPPTLSGGAPSTATITLSFEAPPGGMTVAITCDMPSVTLPDKLLIPAGKLTGMFQVKTVPIPVTKPANIKTLLNGAGPTTPLTIQAPTMVSFKLGAAKPVPATKTPAPTAPSAGTAPPIAPPTTPPPAAVTPPPAVPVAPVPFAVVTPTMTQGTITISGPAPADGLDIAIKSSDPSVELPAKVTIAGGRTSVTFKIRCDKVKTPTAVTLTATLNAATLTAALAET